MVPNSFQNCIEIKHSKRKRFFLYQRILSEPSLYNLSTSQIICKDCFKTRTTLYSNFVFLDLSNEHLNLQNIK